MSLVGSQILLKFLTTTIKNPFYWYIWNTKNRKRTRQSAVSTVQTRNRPPRLFPSFNDFLKSYFVDISAADGRFSWNDLVYFKELRPNRHFRQGSSEFGLDSKLSKTSEPLNRYHIVTAILSITCGSVILSERIFTKLTYQVRQL